MFLFPHCSNYIFMWQVLYIIILHVQMTVRDALNSALDEEMSADPSVFLMGEEVSHETNSRLLSFCAC